jgi:hypothetical protein
MTKQQLELQRNDICFRMIEADEQTLHKLEQELIWIEELLNEQEGDNHEEI